MTSIKSPVANRGFRLGMLTEGQNALLAAMIGAVATVWAIGVAIYQFIYTYFWQRHLDTAERLADGRQSRNDRNSGMTCGLARNFFVYLLYAIAGGLAIFSIYLSGSALASADPEAVLPAYRVFAFAILWHFGIFTIELSTSMRQVYRLAKRIDP